MYTKESPDRKYRKLVRMDPNCAICQSPASRGCDCEARSLEVAVQQAETAMMASIYDDIRSWVRSHARDFILDYFEVLKTHRLQTHELRMERITTQAYQYYNLAPHPNDVSAAQAELKRGIDEDWQLSVQRYPEVLEYFYGLVDLVLPNDNEPSVRDPPLRALIGSRKATRRASYVPGPNNAPPPAVAPSTAPAPSNGGAGRGHGYPPYAREPQALPRGRTPPPPSIPAEHRRTPVARDRRSTFHPPPPASTYYHAYP